MFLFISLTISPLIGGELKIHVINVSLGDATFIEFPDGTTWLIDQGINGTVVHDYINTTLGYSTFNTVVATHFDRDHYGGINEVLSPPVSYTTAAYEHVGPKVTGDDSYTATWDAETTSPMRSSPSPGQTWNFGGATVECVCVGDTNGGYNELLDSTKVYPDLDENSFSLGFRISYGGFDYLTCGDLTDDVENVLAPKISSSNFDVLHVDHHGSSTSTSLYFCETLQPEAAVISVGSSNSYGHPTQTTINNLNGVGSSWSGVDRTYVTEQGSGGGGSASNLYYLSDHIVITYNDSTNQYTVVGGSRNDLYTADEVAGGTTPTPTPTPTGSTPTPTPTPTSGPGDIVVNQVGPFSVAGGGVGEYVELYNSGSTGFNLDGWKLNVYSNDYTFNSSDVIPANGYYLIADENPCGGVVPDVDTDIGITDNGANSFAQILNASSEVMDTVGWSTSSLYEGTKLGALGGGKAWKRNSDGADTNDNISDFSQATCDPRNSSTGPPTATPNPTSTPTKTPTPSPTPTSLPYQVFFDDFPTGIIDTEKWTYNSGSAESNTTGIGEPSGTYSLNLDGHTGGGDEVQSKIINLSIYDLATLTYYWQRRGNGNSPESGEDLWIDYWDGSDWVNLAQYPGSGDDMTVYSSTFITLPSAAIRSDFQLRISSIGTQSSSNSYDDWLVDDVKIGAGYFTPTPSPTPWVFPKKVNYQLSDSEIPSEHAVDDGSDYGTHGNYGW